MQAGAPAVLRQLRQLVLTRLHTRYDKATLSEDLIFREASPMIGGRANTQTVAPAKMAATRAAGVEREQLPGPLHHPPLLVGPC